MSSNLDYYLHGLQQVMFLNGSETASGHAKFWISHSKFTFSSHKVITLIDLDVCLEFLHLHRF